MLDVLYDVPSALAVVKPAGLLTQAPPSVDSLEVRVRAFLAQRSGVAPTADAVYVGVPHRLDRPVSGAMVFARDLKATRSLGKQFERRYIRKTYWACVQGSVSPEEGQWRDYVRKLPGVALAEVVPQDHPQARSAVLRYRTLDRTVWGSWLEIELETGRTHQIRVQAASRGHPVLGDTTYGGEVSFGEQHEDPRLAAIALHARKLAFRNPATQEDIAVTAPLPAAWKALELPIGD